MSREALQGLRQAVGGYREADLASELVSARSALDAAGIAAELPADPTVAARDVRSLFAWVLREGVTNVIRHSGASTCRVRLTRTALTVDDDGRGPFDAQPAGGPSTAPPPATATPGHGLRGLRERAYAAGATLTTGVSDLGGFRLAVERGRR